MDIVKNISLGTFEINLKGKFTFSDHPEFRAVLQKIEEHDVQSVVMRMDHLEFVDSAALGMLLLALDVAEKHQKKLAISGATGQVKKMFDLARFDTLFVMC